MKRLVLFLSIPSLLLFGCSPEFDNLEMEQLSTPPIATSLVSDHIELTSGTGILIRVKPVSGNSEPYDDTDKVELESENIDLMRVYKGERFREFGIVGCEVGTTRLRVLINGRHERSIDVTIR